MKRPQLEGEEELNNKQDEQDEQDVMRTVEVAAVNMDVKIKNIRMMARQVTKIETVGRSADEEYESDEPTSNEAPVMEKETLAEVTDSAEGNELQIQASNETAPGKIETADTDVSDKEVQFTSMQNRPSNPEIAEGSIVATQLELGKSEKTSDMFKYSDSNETSDVSDENAVRDTGIENKGDVPDERSPDKSREIRWID